jgi:hypothetical protein
MSGIHCRSDFNSSKHYCHPLGDSMAEEIKIQHHKNMLHGLRQNNFTTLFVFPSYIHSTSTADNYNSKQNCSTEMSSSFLIRDVQNARH